MNQNFRIAITPLSPIHIGCGEDFEPTSYVVDPAKKRLYSFNPASVFLPEDVRKQLLDAVSSGEYKKVHAFFGENLTQYRPYANTIVPMDEACVWAYKKMLKPTGNQKDTRFEIERATYVESPEFVKTYIPGASLKGVIKTALVDCINSGHRVENKQIDTDVLGGKFAESPMRFLKVSDLHAESRFVLTQARCGKRFFKEASYDYTGVSAYFETIEPWQYRVFTGDITLVDGTKCDGFFKAYKSISALVHDVNAYSLRVWDREVAMYRSANYEWAEDIEELLRSIQGAMAKGKVALVRLGKNTGAESKTLSGGIAEIRIKHRDWKKRPTETLDHTTTLCFASEESVARNGKEVVSGMPFGWALLEVLEGNEELTSLKNLCSSAKKMASVSEEELQSEWDAIQAERSVVEGKRIEDAQRKAKQKEEQKRIEEIKKKEEEEKLKRLQSLTKERRASEELIEKLVNTKGNIGPGTELFIRVKEFLEAALAWESSEDKRFLAEKIRPQMKSRSMFQGKHEKSLKQLLRELEGK